MANWRDSGHSVRFGTLDGRLAIFLFATIFHMTYVTIAITCTAAVLFWYLEQYKGYNVPNALRKLNVLIAGNKRVGIHWWRVNKFWHH